MKHAAVLLLVVVGLVALPAAAQSHDWYGRFGLGSVSLNATSDTVAATGSGFDVESSSPGFRLDIARSIATNLALEGSLLVGRVDLAASGGNHDGVSAGQAWSTSASVLLVWRIPMFGDVRPFVAGGVGLAALPYYIRDNGARSIGLRDVETGLGVGPAAAVGVDYHPGPRSLITFDVRWVDAPVDLDVVNDAGTTVDSIELPFDPVTVNLAFGWRF